MSEPDILHEAPSALSTETIDGHRALRSLMEELEAVDWYAQRVDATDDAALKAVLAHNRDEEKEHAALFTEGPIRESEEALEHEPEPREKVSGLGIGSLRGEIK